MCTWLPFNGGQVCLMTCTAAVLVMNGCFKLEGCWMLTGSSII